MNVQLFAVRKNNFTIYYIQNPNLDIQLESVKNNPNIIECIKSQHILIKINDISRNPYLIECIKNHLLYYDIDMGYYDYVKGKYKFVETLDENKYEYVTKVVHNEFYPEEFNSKPIEDFERNDIVCKYNQIQKYILEQK